ncbi:hypothetical protein [endosymbiont of Lamellibrachia barhami]|uniref:hypothetical protein n=1 Tax=endosymbiont of Lamellibrachia barhami TaxID=205975 RepID=UPI0015AEE284|nr:hypothetical protein [endosymbiont of Lamellibrachia barhami]
MNGTISQPNANTLSDRYRFQRSFLNVMALILSGLLLSACGAGASKIKLTNGHMDKLRLAFVGREFVFQTDWHSKMVIYKGKPVHWYATHYNQSPHDKKEQQKIGKFQARGGDVATFTDARPWTYHALALYFKNQQGNRGILRISTPNKDSWGSEFYEDMTNQVATVAWVEDQLTNATIKFLDKTETDAAEIPAALPTPPTQPELTPVAPVAPAPAQMAEPSISRLTVTATPSRVRHGEVLKLQLDYTIDAADGEPVQVTESRNLVFNSKALPGYPKERQETRSSGKHATSFRQKIPSRATPGTYTYKGEVCIPAGCSSRLVRFTIEP